MAEEQVSQSLTYLHKTISDADIEAGPSHIYGRGVFALRAFDKGELIEQSYVLVLPHYSAACNRYIFQGPYSMVLMPLGYIGIYNHINDPNAVFRSTFDNDGSLIAQCYARQAIQPGEEIYINYGQQWFRSRHAQNLQPFTWSELLKQKSLLKATGLSLIATALMAFFLFY